MKDANTVARISAYTRHKCFISYHHADATEVQRFVATFDETQDLFIARGIGAGMAGDIIDSSNSAYIMSRVREEYLRDSTVTIVLIGKCTWARRFVDWEIASTLRNDLLNRRSGLLGITLPSTADYAGKQPPPCLKDNLDSDIRDGYARWKKYPTSTATLATWIEDAYQARDSRSRLVDNSRQLFGYTRRCP
jgi:hypothetical protein